MSVDFDALVMWRAENSPEPSPLPRYEDLPLGPAESGDLAACRSLDELNPDFRGRLTGLLSELESALGRRPRVTETYRSDRRQAYLWGCGRFYQLPGRRGIVTKIRKAVGKHKARRAVDLWYGLGVTAEEVRAVVEPHAARLESTYRVRWGDRFSFRDTSHWEDAS